MQKKEHYSNRLSEKVERILFRNDDQNPEEPEPVESEPEKRIPTKRMKKPKTKNEKTLAPLFTTILKFEVIYFYKLL